MQLSTSKDSIQGSLVSIWWSRQWKNNLVHGVCSSKKQNRPAWCGGQNRPSGYSVREHPNYSLITVFDPKVEETLNEFGKDICKKIWPSS